MIQLDQAAHDIKTNGIWLEDAFREAARRHVIGTKFYTCLAALNRHPDGHMQAQRLIELDKCITDIARQIAEIWLVNPSLAPASFATRFSKTDEISNASN